MGRIFFPLSSYTQKSYVIESTWILLEKKKKEKENIKAQRSNFIFLASAG